jgi:hypothetical protein
MRSSVHRLLTALVLLLSGLSFVSKRVAAQACSRVRVSLVDSTGATDNRPLLRLSPATDNPDVLIGQDASVAELRMAILQARSICRSRPTHEVVRILDVIIPVVVSSESTREAAMWCNIAESLRAAAVVLQPGYGRTRTKTFGFAGSS